MKFKVLPPGAFTPVDEPDTVFLTTDKWDDWFLYNTQFWVEFVDSSGEIHDIGAVKIGQLGMKDEQRAPLIPDEFEALSSDFFSVGQTENYYLNLAPLGAAKRRDILAGLQDLALWTDRLDDLIDLDVMKVSLLRSVDVSMIKGRFSRLAVGDAALTPYRFSYTTPVAERLDEETPVLSFDVVPGLLPPTNIHVLIGHNGVGKTYYLSMMCNALLRPKDPEARVGRFQADVSNRDKGLFSGLVYVAFSAFDPFDRLSLPKSDREGMSYSYVGLKKLTRKGDRWSSYPKSLRDLESEFITGVSRCLKDRRQHLWREALEDLESDKVFADHQISRLAIADEDSLHTQGVDIFRRLSSGHKVVLLTITRLVEDVVERSLVLMDEPESHLHPPLLSAFVRALSRLLTKRNGVAIVATHSPVVLQEVPSECVWILNLVGNLRKAERPDSETFGENLGILTREAFRLQVSRSGFHSMLRLAVDAGGSYEEILEQFDGHLGGEAKAILRSLVATRDKEIGR